VARTAAASVSPSKSKFRAIIKMSKKSFMRLFVKPNETSASSFSAMTVSRGYARSRGLGMPSSDG
jgi:hypothetical protein